MSSIRMIPLAVAVATGAFPAAASAAPERPTAGASNGIIAILIGAKAAPFTPPIGTNHGS